MKTFHLKTCDTCKRILSELNLPSEMELREIKSENIKQEELEAVHQHIGSYESLFNKRARKFTPELKAKSLTEADYKKLILEEYTFLKRPVFLFDDAAFAGNSKKVIESVKAYLNEK